jgi:hypothetical protein
MTDKQLKSILDYFKHSDIVDYHEGETYTSISCVKDEYDLSMYIHYNTHVGFAVRYRYNDDFIKYDNVYELNKIEITDYIKLFISYIKKSYAEENNYRKQEFNKLIGFDGE